MGCPYFQYCKISIRVKIFSWQQKEWAKIIRTLFPTLSHFRTQNLLPSCVTFLLCSWVRLFHEVQCDSKPIFGPTNLENADSWHRVQACLPDLCFCWQSKFSPLWALLPGSHLVRYQFRLCNVSSKAPYLRRASSSWWIFFFIFVCACVFISRMSAADLLLLFYPSFLPTGSPSAMVGNPFLAGPFVFTDVVGLYS